jgi:hypothetical protein
MLRNGVEVALSSTAPLKKGIWVRRTIFVSAFFAVTMLLASGVAIVGFEEPARAAFILR